MSARTNSTGKPVTIAQIAARAGVHAATVSRALADPPTSVGQDTVLRIRALAVELGYVPDPAASSLRTRRSRVLGVLVPLLTDYVLARIYEGVDDGASQAGYSTVVTSTNDDPATRLDKLDKLLGRRVEGVIVGDARLGGDEVIATLARRGIPFVMVNRRLQGHPSVTTDDVCGGELAAAHLLRLGHLRVGVVAGHSHASTNVERVHGFTRTLRRAGVEVEERLVVDSDSDADGGYAAATHILQTEPRTTAIFAINDFAAIGAMGAARESGRRPGHDIAVIGYNDVPLVRHLPVPLTSVSSPMERMGRRGADLLCQIIDGADVEAELLEPTLIERGSTTGVLPFPTGEDPVPEPTQHTGGNP